MRILVVSPYLPSRGQGSQVRLRGLLTRLARSHSLTLAALVRPNEDPRLADEARAYCDKVVTVPNDRFFLPRAKKRVLQLGWLLSRRSSFQIVHRRADFQAALNNLLERSTFDLVEVENCFMSHYALPPELPIVVDEHNIDYEILARTAAVARAQPRGFFNQIDALKLKREEESCWRTADACAVTSPHDEALVRAAAPSTPVAVVPNAVDTEYFAPASAEPSPSTILFFGTLSYYPNTEGLLFFLREVLPLVRRSHPSARLVVVGAAPPGSVRRFEAPDVVFTGAVPDLRPYLQSARVVIAPLHIGGGTRLKILEAMAMARPVVSTSLGAEGIAVTHERDILLANDATAFAAEVGRLLDDRELAERIGAAARALVERHYDWSGSARALEALQRAAILARSRSASRPSLETVGVRSTPR